MSSPHSGHPSGIERGTPVLVTGGAGFIGRALVAELVARGAEVRVLDALIESVHGPDAPIPHPLQTLPFFRADIRDRGAVAEAVAGAEVVYHLAAETGTGESMYRAERYVDVNVRGTAVLLDAIADAQVRPRRFVLGSSRAVYGEGAYRAPDGEVHYPGARSEVDLRAGRWDPMRRGEVLEPLPHNPDCPTAPTSVYGETKRAQEALLRVMAPTLGVDAWILRFQNVYGPGQSTRNPYTGILSIFSVLLLEGKKIRIFEDGDESRDFVFVDDVVEALVRCVGREGGGIVDVGSGVRTTVATVARALAEALDVPADRLEVTGEYRLGDIRHAFADTTALAERLGHRPSVSFEQGVARLLAWIQETERPTSTLDRALEEMSKAGLMGSKGSA